MIPYDLIWYYEIYQRALICIVLDIHVIAHESVTEYNVNEIYEAI